MKIVLMVFLGLITINMMKEMLIDDEKKIQIPVLMYHTFENNGKFPSINTSVARFEEHLLKLKENGYTFITSKDLVDYLNDEINLPEKSILITIDDGYESVYNHAFPVLQKYNIIATVFPIAKHIETGERLGLSMMSWEQLREMYSSGLVEVQNHTYDLHWRLNDESGKEGLVIPYTKNGKKLSDSQHINKIKNDIEKASKTIEQEIGTDVFAFTYPYGAYNLTSEQIVSKEHIIIFTTEVGLNSKGDNPLRIKRININNNLTGDDIIKKINSLGKTRR
ncbi:polysaccharide deacetylase family protein [Cytobacillus sp. IB215665]|uniref:polysaccharide deacetylase family protein n=1 Tax=Cytobacillus sp. IB215665 TaxID=3097357 RepID=UPI002A0B5F9A|nr:polysaccharide deacetylase family protein [Cytobacillus sp. IB215665]MDX8367215.1 polysaccharide deacetylase family protein [Cytobacillus sp. IB215665]